MGNMKRFYISALAVTAMFFGAASHGHSAPDLLAKWHFIGASDVGSDTNGAKLKQILSSKMSVQLRDEALDKFSRMPVNLQGRAAGQKNVDASSLVRPLLDDIVSSESIME